MIFWNVWRHCINQPRKFYLNPWATSKRQKSFLNSGPTHQARVCGNFSGIFHVEKKWNQGHLSCQFAYKTNANGILLVPCYIKTKNSTYLNFGNYAAINGNLNHCDIFCHVIETLECCTILFLNLNDIANNQF